MGRKSWDDSRGPLKKWKLSVNVRYLFPITVRYLCQAGRLCQGMSGKLGTVITSRYADVRTPDCSRFVGCNAGMD